MGAWESEISWLEGSELSPLDACVLDPTTDPRWSELVERVSGGGVFHHPLWLGLLRDRYGYQMSAVCLAGSGGELVGGLPIAMVRSRLTGTRLVSVPFSDVCGPIAVDSDTERALLAAVDAERRRLGLSLEVHADVPSLPGGTTTDRFVHHVVPLEGGANAVLAKRVSSSKRSGASRARRLGVTVTQQVDSRGVEEYFRLHIETRHRQGIPTQPRQFFRGLPQLFDHGLGFVLLAEWEGRPIAGAVYLRYKSTLTYKYGASLAEHYDKRPNNLLHLEALRIGCESGCSVMDMGRTEPHNEGLRRFKRQLGAEERELSYTAAPPVRKRKRLPALSNIQRTIIRRTPAAVGRLLGAAAYRHVG
jgi:CelD/BcsL family acetyltransferase involved in cellulose biosynthesis